MSIFDDVRQLIQRLGIGTPGPSPILKETPRPQGQVQPQPQNYKQAVYDPQATIRNIGYDPYANSPQANKPVAQSPTPPMATPPQAQIAPNDQQLEKQIRMGLRGQLGRETPIEKYIPQFIQAAKQYPIFQKYPFLLPQVAILESSGGLNVTRNNNPLNWAARVQANNPADYSPASWQQSIDDAITGVGGDYKARPKGTTRAASADYYQPFRDSGNIADFVKTFEPANPSYLGNLTKGIAYFNNVK